MRYRCISVLEEYICTQDYTPFGGPAWGLPVKMLNIFTPNLKLGVSDPSARGPGDPCGPHSLGHCNSSSNCVQRRVRASTVMQ